MGFKKKFTHFAVHNSAYQVLSVCCDFTSRCLVTDIKKSSAFMLTFLSAYNCPTTNSLSKSKSKSRYDWWSVSKYVLMSSPFWFSWPDVCYCMTITVVEVEAKLRPTVSRPDRLGVRHPSGICDEFLFLLEIFFRPLRVYYFVAPSLTRGRACNLLLLLVLASAVPRDSRPYFIVPILETPPTWRARSPYLYPPGTWWPRYIPGHWVPFPSPLTTLELSCL
jgi:hypothetical protein